MTFCTCWIEKKSKIYFLIMVCREKKILATLGPKLWIKKSEKWPFLRLILG
jgi:hypothetical protein